MNTVATALGCMPEQQVRPVAEDTTDFGQSTQRNEHGMELEASFLLANAHENCWKDNKSFSDWSPLPVKNYTHLVSPNWKGTKP